MESSSGWFVALGRLISIVGTVATTWLTLRATSNRERRAREHELRVKMAEFQFETMLKLQDAMTEFNQDVSESAMLPGEEGFSIKARTQLTITNS